MYSIKIDWQVYQQVSEWYSWVNKYSYAFEENTMSCYIRTLYFYFLLFFSRIIYFFSFNFYIFYIHLFLLKFQWFPVSLKLLLPFLFISYYIHYIFPNFFDQYSRLNYFHSSTLLVLAFLFKIKCFVLFSLD